MSIAGAPVLLDMGGATAPDGPERAPAWLVHAALKAGAAVGFPFRVGDHVAPIRAQVLTRTARVPWSSDAVVLLEVGIPSIVLTDFSALHPYDAIHTPDDVPDRLRADRLSRWVVATAATVRRSMLSRGGLAGKRSTWPSPGGSGSGAICSGSGSRCGSRWCCAGTPGRWAGARGFERRARGRSYLPGYLFRVAFLLAAILIPALAAPLLYPLAPLGMITPRSTASRWRSPGSPALPAAGWLGLLAVAGWLGLASGLALPPGRSCSWSSPWRPSAGSSGRARRPGAILPRRARTEPRRPWPDRACRRRLRLSPRAKRNYNVSIFCRAASARTFQRRGAHAHWPQHRAPPRADRLHVQTEDKGRGNPQVVSLIYVGGRVLAASAPVTPKPW